MPNLRLKLTPHTLACLRKADACQLTRFASVRAIARRNLSKRYA